MRKKKPCIPKMKNAINTNQVFFNSKHNHFIKSFFPKEDPNYIGHMCWHGCDKVSRIGYYGDGGGSGS